MQATKIEVNDNLQETAKHGSYDFPIAVYTDKFNLFEDGHIRWHWHKELQFSYCLYDKLVFSIGNQKLVLNAGEGLMINSNVLHQIKPYNNANCMMFSICFDWALISGNEHSIIEKKYLNPILKNNNLKFISLTPSIEWQENILKQLVNLFSLDNEKAYGYELAMRNCLGSLWLDLIRELKVEIKASEAPVSHDEERVKLALEYIHKYYAENISLYDIAAAANISKSECCRSFKRTLRVTPFEYLMEYRVLKASELLLKSKKSVSTIAFDVGFNGPSYFGKIFKKYMKCSPSEYRTK